MPIQISREQFQHYQQQWNQPVEDSDLEGWQQKKNAAYWLAYCYWFAEGGVERNYEQNERRAAPILEQAVQEQDHIDDNNHLDKTGKHRYLLGDLIPWNPQRANELRRQAVPRLEAEVQEGGNDKNFQQAAHDLGDCLFYGKGVDKDPSRGIRWLKAAAELGHEGAQLNLFHDCSREPYVAEVFGWWLEMAGVEHEHAWAQLALGKCFGDGRGVEKDLVVAVEWYNKAIAQGFERATTEKEVLFDGMSPEERNKTLGCVTRNQKIEKVEYLIEQPEPDNVPLGLWTHVIATFQHQEHPPWESPSPTFISLRGRIMPQLQVQSSNRKRTLPSEN